jgi:hypothetical protein
LNHITERDLGRAKRCFQGEDNKQRRIKAMDALAVAYWVDADDNGWMVNRLVHVRFAEYGDQEAASSQQKRRRAAHAEKVINEDYL